LQDDLDYGARYGDAVVVGGRTGNGFGDRGAVVSGFRRVEYSFDGDGLRDVPIRRSKRECGRGQSELTVGSQRDGDPLYTLR
jgi:hypothetical protein